MLTSTRSLWPVRYPAGAQAAREGGRRSKPMMAGRASRFQAYTRRWMADKPAKPKAKPRREPAGVLGTLPAKRPERLGRPRNEKPAKRASKPAARRPKLAPKPPAAHGPKAVRPASSPLTSARRTSPAAAARRAHGDGTRHDDDPRGGRTGPDRPDRRRPGAQARRGPDSPPVSTPDRPWTHSGGPRPPLPVCGRRTRTTSMRATAAVGQRRPLHSPAMRPRRVRAHSRRGSRSSGWSAR